MIEYPGLTVSEQIELMKKLNIWSPDVENVLKWHPNICKSCGVQYFPSGSAEVRCWKCGNMHRKAYKCKDQNTRYHKNVKKSRSYYREYMRKYREKKNKQ